MKNIALDKYNNVICTLKYQQTNKNIKTKNFDDLKYEPWHT